MRIRKLDSCLDSVMMRRNEDINSICLIVRMDGHSQTGQGRWDEMALRTRCNKLRLRPDDEGREDLADWLTWSGVYLTANCWVACGRSLTRIPKSSLTFPSLPIQSFPYQQLVILSIELRGVGKVTNAIYLLHLLLFSEGCDGSFVCCLLRGHWYLSTIVTRRLFGKWQFWEIEHFSIEKIPMQCGQQKDWSVILIWGYKLDIDA